MFWIILFTFIALMVGWATPQPAWAKKLTDAIVGKFKEVKGEDNTNDF